MAIEWKVKEFLQANNITPYKLMKTANLARGTAYRLANNKGNGIDLKTLDSVLQALNELAEEDVNIADVIEYRRS